MRPESNPLDLNNLPEDYNTIEGKQLFDEASSSSSGQRKKKNSGKDGKDECDKVYECRFCSLKFCKSQALGGHMNRHRQERETETMNRARQLVFNSDHNSAAQGGHLGCHPMAPGSYHSGGNIRDPYKSVCPPRLFSAGSSSTHFPPSQQPPHRPYLYSTPPPSRQPHYLSQFPQQPMNDCYVGHVLDHMGAPDANSYTCIGAPVRLGGFGPRPLRLGK